MCLLKKRFGTFNKLFEKLKTHRRNFYDVNILLKQCKEICLHMFISSIKIGLNLPEIDCALFYTENRGQKLFDDGIQIKQCKRNLLFIYLFY